MTTTLLKSSPLLKYKIEGNLNFYDELNKMLLDEDNETESDNICLLSKDKLEPNHITLECKHKFNYLPLYKEVVNQKTKNDLEVTKLDVNHIKCPYCRSITKKLLPFIPYQNIKKIIGVNHPVSMSMPTILCSFVYTKGINKDTCCKKNALYYPSVGLYCNKHYEFILQEKFKQEEKQKKKQNNNEKTNIPGCSAIIKSGPKKGEKCGCKTITNIENNTCSRHSK